jgi:hypothetical protein
MPSLLESSAQYAQGRCAQDVHMVSAVICCDLRRRVPQGTMLTYRDLQVRSVCRYNSRITSSCKIPDIKSMQNINKMLEMAE